jgi:leucyl/phenylalanyl-tRNA--protein transferase
MKRRIVFPEIETATEDGLVAIGGDLEVDTLLEAYKKGIFPWPISLDFPLAWFSPNTRGLLKFDELHVSKSFEKFLKKPNFEVTYNQAFSEVIKACARIVRKNQPSTWITPGIIQGYQRLFEANKAYSVEVWNHKRELVGGIYGVVMGDFISGESMFMVEDNASKYGLYSLIKKLESSGVKWLDTQMVTNIVEQFGGQYIARHEFITLLEGVNWDINKEEIFKRTTV